MTEKEEENKGRQNEKETIERIGTGKERELQCTFQSSVLSGAVGKHVSTENTQASKTDLFRLKAVLFNNHMLSES